MSKKSVDSQPLLLTVGCQTGSWQKLCLEVLSFLFSGTRCSLFFLFARVLFAWWLAYVSEKRKKRQTAWERRWGLIVSWDRAFAVWQLAAPHLRK